MTSTSCITGTGLKKCMPMTCVGALGLGGDFGDGDGAGVGREDGFGWKDAVEVVEEARI